MLKNLKINKLFRKADSFFKENKYDESLKYYNEILKLDDSNLKALYKKAYIFYKLKLFDESIEILNTILGLKNCIESLLLLGRINLLENNYEKGMHYYKLSLNDDIFDSCKFVKEILFFGHYKFRYTCKDYKRFYSITVSLCDLYLEKDDTYETKLFKSHNLYKLGYYENALSIIDEFPESYLNNP